MACAHGRAAAPQVQPRPVATAEDPTTVLIREADAHLASGQAELKDGHLNKAREEFDKAVEAYLTSPGGAYSNTRLADAYRRTLDAIHEREVEALAAGDGFAETPGEPASIDEVGDIALTDAVPTEEAKQAAIEAVKDEFNDLPIELNNAVVGCIDLYQGRLREWFGAALSRGGRYLPHIRAVFASEGIPRDLAYVALVESAFKTSALSRTKAKGVWQFMPKTARDMGLQRDWWIDERSSPEKATRAAAAYLKQLYSLFGDWNLALAGYNAGPGKVLKGINRYGTNDFWRLAQTRAFKRETKNYVPMIHAAIVVAKAPEKYGIEIEPEPTLVYENAPVKGAVDLRTISECAETSVDQIQLLNPELRRLTTPANRTFDLRVPPGSGDKVQKCVESLPPEKRVAFRTHVVARGQTLASIARRYGSRTTDIAEANGLRKGSRLAKGTELIIPVYPSARTLTPQVTRTAQAEAPTGHELQESDKGPRVSYRIKPGDTLYAIASQYGTTIQKLQIWNRLRRTTRLAIGSVLTIYTKQ